MLDKIPSAPEIATLIGPDSFKGWEVISQYVRDHYVMDELWNKGGRPGPMN